MSQNVLIVDDQPRNLEALEASLKIENVEFIKALSGQEALDLALKFDVSLVLLDVMMPEMDGYEVAQTLKSIPKYRNIPIIFLTAINFEDESIRRGYDSGAADYLFKPINYEIVTHKVSVFLELDRQKKLLQEEIENKNRVEKELRKKEAELLKSNEDLNDFASMVSHDLVEPLRGIKAYSDFLKEEAEDKLNKEEVNYIDSIVRLCGKLDKLISNLLHYSRVGRTELSMVEVNLNDTLNDILESFSVILKTKLVKVNIANSLPTIVCDEARVGEIFRNLIGNAIKYNDKTEKVIEIGLVEDESKKQGKSTQVFYIKDNGIGIKEKHFATIFKIFRQLNAKDEYGEGCGFGMTLVKKIIERHQGEIWLDSKFGEGTTFYFTLAPN